LAFRQTKQLTVLLTGGVLELKVALPREYSTILTWPALVQLYMCHFWTLRSLTAPRYRTVPVMVAASTTTRASVMLGGLEWTALNTRVSTCTTAAITAGVLDRVSADVTVGGCSQTAVEHPAYFRITAPVTESAHYQTCEYILLKCILCWLISLQYNTNPVT